MTVVNLHIDSVDPVWADALVSSLPVSVRRADSDAGDLVLVDGQADWPDRLLAWMKQGKRRFMVADPAIPRHSLDEAIAMAEQTGSDVTISETHGDNPAVSPFRDALSGPYSAITLTGVGTRSIADLALQQLRLARRIGLDRLSIVHALASQDSLVATLGAALGGDPLLLRLSIVRSDAGASHHRLLAHAPAETACLEIGSGTTARPATAFRVTAALASGLPALYETAHRAVLRSFADEAAAATRRNDLAGWKQDAAMALDLATPC